MLLLAASLLALVVVLAAVRDGIRKRTSRLPPGPPGLPLLGNILQIPSQFLAYKLHDWSKQYGPIYTFWMMGQPFVVLNSIKVAADVLDRKSDVTSDKPPMIKMACETEVDSCQVRPFADVGDGRLYAYGFNIRSTMRFTPMQENEAAHLALGLLRHPDKPFNEHMHRFAASIIFRSTYGGDTIAHMGPDPSKKIEDLTLRLMAASLPQNSVVDTLPFLKPLIENVKWLRKQADDWYNEVCEEGNRLYDAAIPADHWDATTTVHDLNINLEKYGMTKHDAMWMTLALFMAGQETSHTVLRIFALAMLNNPAVMRAAQEQLDAVCGRRPPTFADRERLPYIDAIIKEMLRWRPPVPLSLLRMASEDFEYQGYTIPKGTTLIDNIWCVGQTRDASVYHNPDAFDPSRFLDASGNLLPSPPDTRSDLLGFGHGRRVCPGKDFAVNGMFISFAYLLWAFQFEWPVDESGKQVICGVDEMESHALVATPRPFGVVLKSRHESLEEHLRAAMKE
ncbi:cytochrome P450 [Calocera viscosa TUFC12733]|uniref:Cytochrome P450 n=1 Tax=Calocera viscosa (strain TUFC12733) TaxID=1330018 RepID=A0A167QGK7_CALVF|nr:cytochrome P450 [Calocera viscosa TUFC12733]